MTKIRTTLDAISAYLFTVFITLAQHAAQYILYAVSNQEYSHKLRKRMLSSLNPLFIPYLGFGGGGGGDGGGGGGVEDRGRKGEGREWEEGPESDHVGAASRHLTHAGCHLGHKPIEMMKRLEP